MHMLIFILAGVLLAEGLLILLVRLAPGLNPREFPTISKEVLEKHLSFDRDLGWANQPNITRTDNSGETPSKYSLDKDGARVNPFRPKTSFTISTYGDSFCFCREVNDNETWQYYLARKMNVNVDNFGQGNYGFDQSLLLLKRNIKKRPSDIVIMAVTPWTIMRILSVWKHYSEFGNTLAVKPRFLLRDSRLKLLKIPITKKEQLLNLSEFSGFFRRNDYHYRNYFLKHQIHFPYLINLFRNKLIAQKFVSELVLGWLHFIGPKRYINTFHRFRSEFELEYKRKLFLKQGLLFEKLVEDFTQFAEKVNCHPVLLILPGYEDLYFMKREGNYYKQRLNTLKIDLPKLMIIDLADLLYPKISSGKDGATLFTKSKFGWPGHFNAKTNELISDFLSSSLKQLISTPLERRN